MKLEYEDLLSGDSIPIDGVGHIRSPKLYELNPTKGIGYWTYNVYLNLLSWDKTDLINFSKFYTGRQLNAISSKEILNFFDVATLIDHVRDLLKNTFEFFMDETLKWDKAGRRFVAVNKEGNPVGEINRDNCDEVRDLMLQANYINTKKNTKPCQYTSERSRKLWEEAQFYLRESSKKSAEDARMQIGNIISKLSCASNGYTLLNIYNLTIYQLYDQFFQYGYLRSVNISDEIFTTHGGKNFDIQAWLKPLTNFKKEKQK